jgi:RNA polymerase sigma-70 factor (ECF subfamily)
MDSEVYRSSPHVPCAAAAVSCPRLAEHRERLIRLVAFRLDPRLRSRVDAADVVQDVYVEAAKHHADLTTMSAQSVFLWLRGVVGNKLLEVHRYHLGTHMRSAKREVKRSQPAAPDATSSAILTQLSGHWHDGRSPGR